MARKKEKYMKAKTCIHAQRVSENGCTFVKDSCKNKRVARPVKLVKGSKQRISLILAKYCEECEYYEVDDTKKKKKA